MEALSCWEVQNSYYWIFDTDEILYLWNSQHVAVKWVIIASQETNFWSLHSYLPWREKRHTSSACTPYLTSPPCPGFYSQPASVKVTKTLSCHSCHPKDTFSLNTILSPPLVSHEPSCPAFLPLTPAPNTECTNPGPIIHSFLYLWIWPSCR